jgi:hypothetical protein
MKSVTNARDTTEFITVSLLQVLSLLTVSVSFSYNPSLEVTIPEADHGQYGYELGLNGKLINAGLYRRTYPVECIGTVSGTKLHK